MNPDLRDTIIAVDFDGTMVEHRYPEIGREVPGAVDTIRWLQACGAKIILYTMRSHTQLIEAIGWFYTHGLRLWGVNTNPDQKTWTTSPKAYAHIYIDDAALGCPLQMDSENARACVNWLEVTKLLTARFTTDDRPHGKSHEEKIIPLEEVNAKG